MGKPNRGELVQGTLDMLVLKTLARAPMHGWGIAQSIQQMSEEVLRVEEGSEERRVGKECELKCRSRWSPYH